MNIDFNTIFDAVAPYVGTGTIGTVIIGFLVLVIKIIKLGKEAKGLFSSVHAESIEILKKAFPEQIIVSVEPIVKTQIEKLKNEILEAVNTNWLDQITKNSELMQAIATALASMKSLPDSEKEKIAELLDIENIETTKSLKVELVPTPIITEPKKERETILVD